MKLISRAFYAAMEMAFRTRESREIAARARMRLSLLQQEGLNNRNDWHMWLLFWAVFLAGCTMAVTVTSLEEHDFEGGQHTVW